MATKAEIQEIVKKFVIWRKDPAVFIKDIWGLSVQGSIEDPFIKGKMLTRQQGEIVEAIRKALCNEASNQITVRSGRGIGKSAISAMLIIWFLACFIDSQVPCTSPSQSQMYDVLWKEIALRLGKMPDWLRNRFDHTSDYLRILDNPKVWFARARTGRKENPEALSGVHADHVFILADEASGVAEEVFEYSKGALTGKNVIFFMISNATRLDGYFYKSHTKLKDRFQCLKFSSLDSPIVDEQFRENIRAEYREGSDEWRTNVLGEFPDAEGVDDKGYVKLLQESDLKYTDQNAFTGRAILGVDPAGEGDDETVWVIKDALKARILKREKVSTPKGIASITSTIMTERNIPAEDVIIDSFGVGVGCIKELALLGYNIKDLYLGKQSNDKRTFLNKRAELYRKVRERIKSGGEFVHDSGWEELLQIKYRRTENNLIQIQSKKDMKSEGIASPNCFIAGSKILTTKGYKNIEDIKIGEKVVTPYGDRLVLKVWENESDKLCVLNGNLVGTPNHKVYTNKGFIRLDLLDKNNTIASDNIFYILRKRIKWLMQLFIKKELSGFKTMVTMGQTSTIDDDMIQERRNSYIDIYGKIIFDQFQKDTMYTTLIGILKIIRLRITNYSRKKNIIVSIGNGDLWMNDIVSVTKHNWMKLTDWQKYDTELKNELNGIKNIENNVEQMKKGKQGLLKRFVSVAEKIISDIVKGLGSVIGNVFKMLGLRGEEIKTIVEYKLSKPVIVYNLTVDKDNVYFCNGYLVSNCADALMLCMEVASSLDNYVVTTDWSVNPSHHVPQFKREFIDTETIEKYGSQGERI